MIRDAGIAFDGIAFDVIAFDGIVYICSYYLFHDDASWKIAIKR